MTMVWSPEASPFGRVPSCVVAAASGCFLLSHMYFQPKIADSWEKEVQQPNPSKPHSSEEGGHNYCDAAIHHCPWLVPQGEQLQPNSFRAPFLSKLHHTGGGAFA